MLNVHSKSVKLPESIHQEMCERIVKDKYGMRGKSLWISEAIAQFLEIKGFPELVDLAKDVANLSHAVSFRITEQLESKLNNAVILVRKEYPSLDAAKSNIIRASIVQRLIRK